MERKKRQSGKILLKSGKKQSEITYLRFEYLADKYARKLYLNDVTAYEYEDIRQEMRMKIFTTVKAYGRRYLKYMRGEAVKPVPIRPYIELALSNRCMDMMRIMKRDEMKTSIDEIQYEIGMDCDSSCVPEENRFIVNDIDLCEGLENNSKEKLIWVMYLKGHKVCTLLKISKKAGEIIDNQKQYLISNYENELLNGTRFFTKKSYQN